ncbi:MAG TPA: succinate dehydrogenase, hydrophobic membrane anchor protein [Woeseiaceae bacterium]|nr:succinate dehydrogenase, hydrophobic membrane anchor protein [Woeseiaceae bacterium]
MSLRSPLSRVLGLGTAKKGTGHFLSQRISALGLLLLGGWFAYRMFTFGSFAYLEVIRFIGSPFNSVLLLLLVLTLAYHSWLGVQVVIEDYVHAPGVKLFALIASRFAHLLVAAVSAYAILQIGLGT